MSTLLNSQKNRIIDAIGDRPTGLIVTNAIDSITDLQGSVIIYVDAVKGSDAPGIGTGSFSNPYKTITWAMNGINDASSSKLYIIKIGAGTYIEPTTFALKDWIYLDGAGMFSTFIKKSDNSAIVWNPSLNMDSRTKGINVWSCSNLWFIGNVNVTRLTTDICYAICQFVPIRCVFVNGLTYNGTGLFQDAAALTFNDVFSPINSIFTGTVNLNSVGNALSSPGVTGSLFSNTVNYNGDSGVNTTVVATVTAVDFAGAHTVTVAPGSGFIATPPGGIGAIQKQSGGGKFTYTSYDDSTGIFSGATLTGGTITVSSIITNAGNQAITFLNSPTANLNLTATKNQLVYTTVGSGKGSVAAQTVTLTGTLAFYSSDAVGGLAKFPTLLSSALPSQVLYSSNAFTLGTSLFSNGNWSGVPTHVADQLKNMESLLFNLNGRQAIPWQGTSSGTYNFTRVALTSPVTVSNRTASFVTQSSITNLSPTVTPSNMGGITSGMSVTGTGIPGGTTVLSVGTNTITLSANATATNGAASLTFSVTGTADNVVVVNLTTPGAVAVNLPAGVLGLTYVIKDGKGDAGTNNITITPAAGTIDGAATYVINSNYGKVKLCYNGTEWSSID